MVPVEKVRNGNGKDHDRHICGQGKQKRGAQRIAFRAASDRGSLRTRVPAHDRLDSLRDPGEHCGEDQSDIGENAVSGHSHIAVQIQDKEVKYNDDDTGGDLGDQRGDSQGADVRRARDGRTGLYRVEMILLPYKMRGQDDQADDRGDTGGDGGSGHSHAQRIDEHIVQHDVGQTSADHSSHGKSGRAVISYKAEDHVVGEKERREKQQHSQIRRCVGQGDVICSKQKGNIRREEQSGCEKYDRCSRCEIESLSKDRAVSILLGLRGRESPAGGSSHSDHKTGPVHEIVSGNGEIQRCQSVGADSPGDEKCVCQNIAGIPDHPENICGYIFEKEREDAGCLS